MRAPGGISGPSVVRNRSDPAAAELCQPRIRGRVRRSVASRSGLPVNPERRVPRNRDLAAQPVQGKALNQIIRRGCLAVQQQVALVAGPYQEVEHRLSLGAQQAGPDRQGAGNIIGDEALQKRRDIFAAVYVGPAGLRRGRTGGLHS